VPYVFNPDFPINTLFMMRVLTGVQMRMPDRFEKLLDVLFTNMWVDPKNLNLPDVTAKMLQQAGFDPAEMIALTADVDVKATLREATEEAVRRGAYGAPTMFVGEEMFFGQDRLDFVEEELKR
jgi:2-hydroxychromene-2-carboxylate isomerase